jgi:hypothetical protein
MSRIISIEDSNRKNKRYKVTLDDGQVFHFGLLGASTYLEHHNKQKREAYRKRHLGNETEKHLIEHLIPSPSLYSYYLLWGDSTDLMTNINILNRLLDD